jgi:hypothetical protein
VPSFEELHGMRPCLVAPTRIIAGARRWPCGGRGLRCSCSCSCTGAAGRRGVPADAAPPASLLGPGAARHAPPATPCRPGHVVRHRQHRRPRGDRLLQQRLLQQGGDHGRVPDWQGLQLWLPACQGRGRHRARPDGGHEGGRAAREGGGGGSEQQRRRRCSARRRGRSPSSCSRARTAPQVRFLEVVDTMVGQLLRRLAEDEERRGGGPYLLAVTGDHSTPVMFGDHSHEPVPFAAAHVRDVVSEASNSCGAACTSGNELSVQPPGGARAC